MNDAETEDQIEHFNRISLAGMRNALSSLELARAFAPAEGVAEQLTELIEGLQVTISIAEKGKPD